MLAAPATYRPTTSPQRLNAKRDGYVERTVTTDDGVQLAVRDYAAAGTRRYTVVLLHGLCLTQDSWAAQIGALRNRWGNSVRVVTYDHRGHGSSGGAGMHTYRIERLAADLAEVLTALEVAGPMTLAGHSMGGMTALAYLGRPAADRPVDPHGLVLVATAAGKIAERGIGRFLGTPATGILFGLIDRMPRGVTDQAVHALAKPLSAALSRYPGTGAERSALAAVAAVAVRTTSMSTAAGFLPSLKRYDEYDTLASIAANTVVLSGGADMLTPADHARDLAAAIPGATHLHIPTAGHMLLQDASHSVSTAINRVMSTDSSPAPQLASSAS